MGFFEKFFKKKTAPVVSSPDKAVAESKSDKNITITTRSAYEERKPIGELSAVNIEPEKIQNIPVNSTEYQTQKREKNVQNVEYRFECQNETYYVIYKNENEFFDGDKVAECGDYILAEGWSGNSQAFALFTCGRLLSIRKCEDFSEGAVVLPSGVAFVFTDSDKVLIMSEAGTAAKTFAYSSAIESERVLTENLCAYVENDGECVVLKCFVFSTQSVWSKKIKYIDDDNATDEAILCVSGELLKVVAPDGVVSQFSFSGEKIKG